jgi:hypothetical protein
MMRLMCVRLLQPFVCLCPAFIGDNRFDLQFVPSIAHC